jgi:hypothetical protein
MLIGLGTGPGGSDRSVTIPAGTGLVGSLTEAVSTRTAQVGDRIEARIDENFKLEDNRSLPDGITLEGRVTKAKAGGRVTGRPEITIQFDTLVTDGREYPISTEPFTVVGKSETKNSAKKAIGGAVAGGVLGAILGNTKKGVLIGAAAGTGVAVATKGGNIELPAGQQLQVRLTQAVTVPDR